MSSAIEPQPWLLNTEPPPDRSAPAGSPGPGASLPFRPYQPTFAVHQLNCGQTEAPTSRTHITQERVPSARPHRHHPRVAGGRTAFIGCHPFAT
jgi:hypothetical protein